MTNTQLVLEIRCANCLRSLAEVRVKNEENSRNISKS